MAKFCKYCGTQLEDSAEVCPNCQKATNANEKAKTNSTAAAPAKIAANSNSMPKTDTGKGVVYASIAVALLNVILPFMKWIEVPLLNSIGSLFGMGNNISSYSLFGYVLSGSSSEGAFLILIVAVIALIGVIMNAIYVIASIGGKKPATRWGTMGATISLIMSILFLIIAGFTQLVLKIITMTPVVYVSIAAAIGEMVLMKKVKMLRK